MRHIVFLFFLLPFSLGAQTLQNLITSINFDNPGCEIKDEFGDPGVVIFTPGALECVCGARGNGRYFDGSSGDQLIVTGPSLSTVLGTIDFTLSFYFKPDEFNNTTAMPQVLFAKRDDCRQDSSFVVKYIPGSLPQIAVDLFENPGTSTSIFATLPRSCWHNITITRKGPELILYHNGKEIKRAGTINGQRVRISNEHILTIANSDCANDAGFRGVMDQIRLYNRSLSRTEIEDLFLFPDHIANGLRFGAPRDTTIFLGGSVSIRLTETCADQFSWSPTTGVDDPDSPTPVITPTATTTYTLEMEDDFCKAVDTIRIIVVDPSSIACGDIFLPTAFTPNDDGLNDRFGISNPFSTGEIIAFEIFDRWGNIVFATQNVLEKWDGLYRGAPVNPGVYLYKLQYRCEGVEDLQSGSVTVIR